MNIKDIDHMTDVELEELYSRCVSYAEQIQHPVLKNCCLKIYQEYKEKYINKSATGGPCHHFYKGGLLYHSYCVTRNAIMIAKMYDYLDIDLDFVIFGALLHDIGKTNEIENYEMIIDGKPSSPNNSFQLLGHSYQGTHIVQNYLNDYDLDENVKNQALHMIGTHMREFSDWGVITSPKMIEAIIINYGDKMDAELDGIRHGINQTKPGMLYQNDAGANHYFKSLNPYFCKKK